MTFYIVDAATAVASAAVAAAERWERGTCACHRRMIISYRNKLVFY